MPRWLVQLRAVVRKETWQILADPRILRVLVAAPVLQLLVLGAAVDFDVDRIPTAIVDQDDTSVTRREIAALLADGTLTGVMALPDAERAMMAMDRGDVAAILVIPEGTTRRWDRREPAPVQVLLDGTDVNRSTIAASTVARYFGRPQDPGGRAAESSIRLAPKILSNPSLETPQYVVPGLGAIVLVMTTTLVTALGLAKEREVGTLEQVLVTPIPNPVLMVGKILPYAVIGLLDGVLALIVGAVVYGVPMRGSVGLLAVAVALYLLSTLGIGLLIATVARNQQQAFMGGFFFVIPAILLSGNMTPVIAMPAWVQPITWVNPLRWMIEILRGVLLEGSGLGALAGQLGALGSIGVVVFALAVGRFRRTLQ